MPTEVKDATMTIFLKRSGHLKFKGVARSARTAPRSLGAGLVDPRKSLEGLVVK
jgi:hypothetical protein